MIRPWYDVALLGYLALFFALEALMLRRESRLGWAMLAKCLFLGTLFGYAAVNTILFGTVQICWCGGDIILTLLRIGIAASLSWAIVEMIRGNRHHGERWP